MPILLRISNFRQSRLDRMRFSPRGMAFVIAISLIALAFRDTGAQTSGGVRGTVRDGVTGHPRAHALVGVACRGCADSSVTDATGSFHLAGFPVDAPLTLVVHCPGPTPARRELLRREIILVPDDDIFVDVLVPPGRCPEPPYSERSGIFRGHFIPGLESSLFIPCPDSAMGMPAGLLRDGRSHPATAWASFAPRVIRQRIVWPADAPRDRQGNSRYYVIWSGTLSGPGEYGHMGVSEFAFKVDSVIMVRRPGRRDCR